MRKYEFVVAIHKYCAYQRENTMIDFTAKNGIWLKKKRGDCSYTLSDM